MKNFAKRFYIPTCVALTCAAFFAAGETKTSIAKSGSETPAEWVALGRRVHGGFGSYIALGIRIGLDAKERLKAGHRELDVTYYDGASTPCACAADGIMIAAVASPGQNSLRVAPQKSPDGTFGVAIIKHKKTGASLRYTVPNSARAFLDDTNKKSEQERYDLIMQAPREKLFEIHAPEIKAPAS